jgi:RNA polymerase sigma-70 factor (ECF subfamily)
MDQSVVQQCQRFNRDAQRSFYEYAYAKSMALCLRYSKNQDQANEMFSQGFLKLCLSIGELKKSQDVDVWIHKKMVEHAVVFLRERRQEYFITSTIRLNGEDVMPEFDLFHQQLEPDESSLTTDEYLSALQALPPSFRAAYNMHVIDGFTDEEISKSLELSPESCKYNLAKAKEIFYKNLTHIQNPC